MPASLLSAKIRGIRSYSPYEHKVQEIEFMPLTLIVGTNGSGKTTVIEALKFMISGEEPPLSDSRRNFLHTSKKPASSFDKNTPYASIQLTFQNARNEVCFAKREITNLSTGKTSTPSISSCYKILNQSWNHIHRQEEWNKTVPLLFNLPNQAILNNVVLCHQEQNQWCMGDSSTVKQIFDRIFGCERYKKEIKHIESEIKSCKNELVLSEKEMSYDKEKVSVKMRLVERLESMSFENKRYTLDLESLDNEIRANMVEKNKFSQELGKIESSLREVESLHQKLGFSNQRAEEIGKLLSDAYVDPEKVSNTDLDREFENHTRLTEEAKKKQQVLKNQESATRNQLKLYESKKISLQDEINNLKVLELKTGESHSALMQLFQDIKSEQDLDELDATDIQKSLIALEKVEQQLLQNKSDQSELEDSLSSKLQRTSKSIANFEGICQGLLHKIHGKEATVKRLSDQLARVDPTVNDLVSVVDNLEKMSLISVQMASSPLVSELESLISESKDLLKSRIHQIKKDGVSGLTDEINRENNEIEKGRSELEANLIQKEDLLSKQTQVEADHQKVRVASKEAHNKALIFKNARVTILKASQKLQHEKEILESKNMKNKQQELDGVVKSINSKKFELDNITLECSKLNDTIGLSFKKTNDYKNNITLRSILKQISAIKEEIVSNEGNSIDEIQISKVRKKLRQVEEKDLKLRDKRSMITGAKLQFEKELAQVKNELKLHHKTNSKYAESLGKFVCNKIITSDLQKLKECFEKSVTNFHDQMIVKINDVLRIKWRQIYRGTDIDSIELVDEEIIRGKDKKAFNYYIAMRKGGIRMKMREKSSAGQKALASIILRMTLAELFVKDFAFIALDEPTANLDLANIKSLANAIGSYVKRRMKKGVNIQWIIITHDEHFLKALDAQCSPYYYRVQLDNEGCSKIVKVSFTDVQTSEPSS